MYENVVITKLVLLSITSINFVKHFLTKATNQFRDQTETHSFMVSFESNVSQRASNSSIQTVKEKGMDRVLTSLQILLAVGVVRWRVINLYWRILTGIRTKASQYLNFIYLSGF